VRRTVVTAILLLAACAAGSARPSAALVLRGTVTRFHQVAIVAPAATDPPGALAVIRERTNARAGVTVTLSWHDAPARGYSLSTGTEVLEKGRGGQRELALPGPSGGERVIAIGAAAGGAATAGLPATLFLTVAAR
jgi:hypothetical protein